MRLKEILKRLAEIKQEVESDNGTADIVALQKEADELIAKKAELEVDSESRTKLLSQIANGTAGIEERNFIPAANVPVPTAELEERKSMQPETTADSAEYRNAFFKTLMNREDEMTSQERAAFTHTTANTAAVLPTQTLNMIWDLVTKEHCIAGDVKKIVSGTTIEIIKHTAVVQGKAAKVAENKANDDEQNTFVKVTLSGADISKHINLSYALLKMAVSEFENYIVTEISALIGEAVADNITAKIKADTATANKITTSAADKLEYPDITKAFALLYKSKGKYMYVSNNTLYTYIVSMVDTTGRPLFQPSVREGVAGTFLGAEIKIEDSVPDKDIFIGDPQQFIYNVVQDIMIENDRDIKNHTVTYSGYTRAEGALINEKAFAILTIKSA